jgi:predicted aspartyl protease
MTLPVTISGRGPYRFVVDTGADRTIISNELAARLGLAAGPDVVVHSTSEASTVGTVVVPQMTVGRRAITGLDAPALHRNHIGAEGMIGLDGLQAQHVLFDFDRRTLTIAPSRHLRDRWPSGTIVVSGRSRFGRLVLIDAAIEGERVWVILDTGSDTTIGNNALRRRLERRGRLRSTVPVTLMSVTGGIVQAGYTSINRLRVGGADIRHLPIAFADVHPFRQLDLLDRPAVLLGMDALQLFRRVSVDFQRREVRFLPFETPRVGVPIRMAGSPRLRRTSAAF